MDCAEFLGGFSEVVDGAASDEQARAAELHVSQCASCRRYREVFATGAELLRTLPRPKLREDFHPRLRHRLFHVADERADRADAGSATPALTVLGMAILITVVAWSPTFGRAPVVQLEPIVVSRPPSTRVARPASALSGFRDPVRSWADVSTGLWDDPRALLYEYSRLSQRYRRESALSRTGLDQDRQ